MIWEAYKGSRESRQRDNIITRCILEDIRVNKEIAAWMLIKLRQEIEILPEKQFFTDPFSVFKMGFWDLAKINLSPKLLSGKKLETLRSIAYRGDYMNDIIRSREVHRMHNQAYGNFTEIMTMMDKSLIENAESF